MRTFFTADLHIGHTNIIKYCNRPFCNVTEMNETIIRNWNSVVKPGDVVHVLGDFCFTRKDGVVENYLRKLNGQVHLVVGNHDSKFVTKSDGFASVRHLDTIRVGNQCIVLCHYAMRVWNKSHHGSWQLYGHSHGQLPDDLGLLSTDVGVDRWNFTPVSFEEIKKMMDKRVFQRDRHAHPKRD